MDKVRKVHKVLWYTMVQCIFFPRMADLIFYAIFTINVNSMKADKLYSVLKTCLFTRCNVKYLACFCAFHHFHFDCCISFILANCMHSMCFTYIFVATWPFILNMFMLQLHLIGNKQHMTQFPLLFHKHILYWHFYS